MKNFSLPSALVSLLLAALLLTSAATAYAECAWVAWSQSVGRETSGRKTGPYPEDLGPWEILDTAPTQAECQARLRAHVVQQAFPIPPSPDRDKAIKDAMQGRENMYVFLLTKDFKIMALQIGANFQLRTHSDYGQMGFNYICLPDTVDPHGPKGK